MPAARPAHVAVVGGGITGLACAYFLHELSGGTVGVTVLEKSPRLGGKLRLGEVGGVTVDLGAESLLARRPEAVELARAVGLGDDVVHPVTTTAALWTRGALRPLPTGTVLGVPGDLRALAASRVLRPHELVRVPADVLQPASPVRRDVAVGRFVAARMGRAVVDRLVEPLLGGVYAGAADELSLQAVAPTLAGALRREGHLLAAARAARGAGSDGPVFAGITGGVGRLPAAVAAASQARVRTGATVRELARTAQAWRLVVGSAAAPEAVEADGVVLAVPAPAAARLLAGVAPAAAADLGQVEYASVAVVSLAWPTACFPSAPPRGSGFLVPSIERRTVKAVTWSSAKWAWTGSVAGDDMLVLRASVGRHREEADLQRPDADLIKAVVGDLRTATGARGGPVDAVVTRWGGALPQYAVGHLDRVDRIRRGVAALPRLAVCGAAYDGIGVAACLAGAAGAARQALHALPDGGTMDR